MIYNAFISHSADTLTVSSPVIADEEVVPVCGSDGHHFVRVAFEHLLHRLHLFLAIYTNFYDGASTDTKELG